MSEIQARCVILHLSNSDSVQCSGGWMQTLCIHPRRVRDVEHAHGTKDASYVVAVGFLQ
jgi:hypothetical protein